MNTDPTPPAKQTAKPHAKVKRQGLNNAMSAIGKQYGETLGKSPLGNAADSKKIKETKPWRRRTSDFHNP